MSKSRTYAWLTAGALAALAALGGYAWHANTRAETLRVQVNPWYGFLPLWLGRDRGIFERHRIRLELAVEPDTVKSKADLVAGRTDLIGSTLDDLVVAAGQGMHAKAVLVTDTSQGADGIVADRSIRKIEDLRGRRVAVKPGFVNHFLLLSVLDLAGMSGKDVVIVPTEPHVAGLEFLAGQHDAAVTWEPFLSQATVGRRGHVLITSADPRITNVILSILLSTDSRLDVMRDAVARFCGAWFEARSYALAHIEELKPYAHLVDMDPHELGDALTRGIVLLSSEQFAALVPGKGPGSFDDLARRAGVIYQREGIITAPAQPWTLRDAACLAR